MANPNPIYVVTNVNNIYADANGAINLTQQSKTKPCEEFFDNFTGDTLNVEYMPIDKVEIFADGVKLYEGAERDFTRVGVDIYFNYMLIDKNIMAEYEAESI